MTTKYNAQSVEQQHLRSTRKFYHSIADMNIELIKVHKVLERTINKQKYTALTAYVDQYISYTNIWNIKFVYNLENPEVVLMQLLHLHYILEREDAEQFHSLRRIVTEQQFKFDALRPYKEEQISLRKEKMLQFIANYPQNSN